MPSWRERKRRERDWRRVRREFIYMDEVSVISLVAARDGGIAQTITDSLSRTVEAEGKISVSVAGKRSGRAGIENRHKVSDSSSSEVVRRTVIQSTFGDLRFGGKAEDALPLVQEYRDLPRRVAGSVATVDDLSAFWHWRSRRLKKLGLLTPLEDIRRGDVIEIDIQLRPNKMFSVSAGIESFVDLTSGRDGIFGEAATIGPEIVPIAEIIDRLMVGLIPIHGASTNIVVVDLDDKPHLIDRRVLKADSQLARTAREWEIVGVTEEPSYWKDLRRILYTRDRFTVYARVENPELVKRWNPVKLSGLMGSLFEGLETAILDLPDEFERHLTNAQPEPAVDLRGVFQHFAELLAPRFTTLPSDTDLAAAITSAVATYNGAGADLNQQRVAFDAVVTAFTNVNDESIDREDLVSLRLLSLSSALAPAARDQGVELPKEQVDQLEVEVVAIYW